MFAIKFGGKYSVKYARSGSRKDGSSYGLIAMAENENQPEGLENPSNSKSLVKIWLGKLPAGITDGSQIVINSFTGFEWKHIPRESWGGKTVYDDVIELVGASVELVKKAGE